MRRCASLITALVIAMASALFGLASAGPAAATPLSIDQCTTTSGAILAVDFSHWGGPLLRSCGTTPTTGYTLLNQGGWKTTGTGHDGPAFICRIGYSGYQNGTQYPTPAQDSCVLTPPASAYWSYWHADPGQNTWTYSQLGAMLYKPNPGSVDLWIFGGTNIEGTEGRPTISPDAVRAHNTSPGGSGSTAPASPPAGNRTTAAPPAPTTKNTKTAPGGVPAQIQSQTQTQPQPPGQTSGADPQLAPSGASPSSATTTASAEALGAGDAPSAGSSPPSDAAPGATSSTGPDIINAQPAADTHHSSGSTVPVVIGVVLLAGLAGGTAYAARRRRHAE